MNTNTTKKNEDILHKTPRHNLFSSKNPILKSMTFL